MRTYILTLLSILTLGCSNNILDPPSSDQDIQEIVFRDLFLHNGSGYSNNFSFRVDTVIWAYYVEFRPGTDSLHFPIGSRIDPDEACLARFADLSPIVKKGSQSRGYNTPYAIADTLTGLPGLLFFVTTPVTRISQTEVLLDGGWYYNANNTGVYTFRLRKEGSRWNIYSVYLDWIS